jgi:hypothetical protein
MIYYIQTFDTKTIRQFTRTTSIRRAVRAAQIASKDGLMSKIVAAMPRENSGEVLGFWLNGKRLRGENGAPLAPKTARALTA